MSAQRLFKIEFVYNASERFFFGGLSSHLFFFVGVPARAERNTAHFYMALRVCGGSQRKS
jgi:hypothetical protein